MTKIKPLTNWRSYNKKDYLNGEWYIDWPSIHRELGIECVEWLMDQERRGHLQMIVEKQDRRMRLTVEFFTNKSEQEFNILYPIYPKFN